MSYETQFVNNIITNEGFTIKAPALLNSTTTKKFRIIGSGYIKNTKTGEMVFAGNVDDLGIIYKKNEKVCYSVNRNGMAYLHKDIKTGEFGINEKVLKVKLPKQLKDATMGLNKIFVDNKLLETFHEDLNNVDKDFAKIVIEDIKRDKDRYCK